MKSKHIVLLGDSIFDNAGYVDEGESVIEQLKKLKTKHIVSASWFYFHLHELWKL